MTEMAILEKLTPLLRDVFDNDEIVAAAELSTRNVAGWDSLGNVRLFLEIEREFSIRFSAAEISSLENVGELAKLIGSKIHRTCP